MTNACSGPNVVTGAGLALFIALLPRLQRSREVGEGKGTLAVFGKPRTKNQEPRPKIRRNGNPSIYEKGVVQPVHFVFIALFSALFSGPAGA